jgi:hypothetical protein
MVQNGAEWCRMVQNVVKCVGDRMLQDATGCYRMLQDATGCYRWTEMKAMWEGGTAGMFLVKMNEIGISR